MSRIGNTPIKIPAGVTVKLEGRTVSVSGEKGECDLILPPALRVEMGEKSLKVIREAENKRARSLHGLYARLISNMVTGVSRGFEKKLEVVGVGYRAEMDGKTLVLQLGFSQPIRYEPMAGIEISLEGKSTIVIRGSDRQKVGETAARIRRFRPPEPYKGKGIKYLGEYIKRKAGKSIA
jgi:large subunit ribosomal protein L6